MKKEQLDLSELIAIGVGGMIGGGIFSVVGMAAGVTGNATPLAFVLGGVLAMLAGYSYARLALTIRTDGASFSYLARAFPKQKYVANMTGWTIVVGYIGTMALYAFTFGAYGAAMFGYAADPLVRQVLSVIILLFFMAVNLRGVRSTGVTEDVFVYGKLLLMALLAVIGLLTVEPARLTPVFNHGIPSMFMAAALVFVAYEGFQLITNGVCEARRAERNVPLGIYISVVLVTAIYVILAYVAIGNMSVADLMKHREYALAEVVKPQMGQSGVILVSLIALMATSSAINATLFGASRILEQMSLDKVAPRALGVRSRADVPAFAIIVLAFLSIVLALLGGLELIVAFSSLTFLVVSIGVSIANIRLRKQTRCHVPVVVLGIILMSATVLTLCFYLWLHEPAKLVWIGTIYAIVLLPNLGWFRFLRRNHG